MKPSNVPKGEKCKIMECHAMWCGDCYCCSECGRQFSPVVVPPSKGEVCSECQFEPDNGHSRACPLFVESKPPHTEEGWEKEFDKRFEQDTQPNDRVNGWLRVLWGNGTCSIALPSHVKDFIRSQISLAEQRGIDKVLEQISALIPHMSKPDEVISLARVRSYLKDKFNPKKS